MKNIFFIITIILFIISCRKEAVDRCLKSAGEIGIEERKSKEFNRIEVEDYVNVILIQDSVCKIKVEAGKNIVSYITTVVENNTLFIKNKNRCDWLRSYKQKMNVYVSFTNIKEIMCRGSGTIVSKDTLNLKELKVHQIENNSTVSLIINTNYSSFNSYSGFGDFIISGKSEKNNLYSLGYGKIDCSRLVTSTTVVKHKGTGDFYVNSKNELNITIEYIGSVYYIGNPSIIKTNITGKGKLIKL